MSRIPFTLRRPFLLMRDICMNRRRPDIDRLGAITDADTFVWSILPHAARTFSACILMLPSKHARVAAVGYLYSRILDTYEDLYPDKDRREDVLLDFARRFDSTPMPAAPEIAMDAPASICESTHLLLINRCHFIDEMYQSFDPRDQQAVRELVRAMATGMAWATRVFRDQGGALENEDQLLEYCRHVLGNPMKFIVRILRGEPLSPELEQDAMSVGELVQLANVTRDIEKDLVRHVGYSPSLRPLLGTGVGSATAQDIVRRARADMMRIALRRSPAYRRMVKGLGLRHVSLARGASALLLLFTDRYWRSCARVCGINEWRGPRHSLGVLLQAVPAIFSPRWCERVMRRVERDFLAACG